MSQKRISHATGVSLILVLIAFLACGQVTSQTPSVTPDVEASVVAGVQATRQVEINLQATLNAAVLATQSFRITATATVVPLDLNILDKNHIRDVILNEIIGIILQDLATLEELYAAEATIINYSGTSDDPDDDLIWRGWDEIEQYYQDFFSSGYSILEPIDLEVEINDDQALMTYQGMIIDGLLHEQEGTYTLQKIDDEWLITRLELSQKSENPSAGMEMLYQLELGGQHRYEEPWGWDHGDPCEAWRSHNFDDTKPHYRGFNVELLLTNYSDAKIPDDWTVTFETHKGQTVQACHYQYEGAGPPPGETRPVTFFTVVEQGDFVEIINFNYNDQMVRLCLDGEGGSRRC